MGTGHTTQRRVSRLDQFIRRMTAQRACIEHVGDLIRDVPGPILEVGLGKGRTFDHMRLCYPERHIWVFDRHIAAHPDAIPDPQVLFLGEFSDTLPDALARIGATAALVHADFGSDNPENTRKLALWLGPWLAKFAAPGAIILTDQTLSVPELTELPLPAGVEPGSYHIYRR